MRRVKYRGLRRIWMKPRYVVIRIMVVVMLLFAGCRHDDGLEVSAEQVYGVWQKAGTQEYWSYREDGTGYTWDVADDIMHEGDSGSVAYNWSITGGNRLRHQLVGTNIGNMVVRTHTITSISDEKMVREEEIATYTLKKIND